MDAMRAPRFSDVRESERLSELARLLYEEYARKGQGASGADELAYRLDRDLADYYGRQLTLPEVLLALRWGLRGEYGEFTGLNADRLFRFVRGYMESPERQEAVRRMRADAPGRGGEPTADEIARRNWEAMLDYAATAYGDYRESGRLPGTQTEPAGGLEGALVIAQRHCEACCYRWLKAVGVVKGDADAFGAEARALRAAARMLRLPEARTRALADAMMLEGVFRAADAESFDFPARLAELAETPEEERRFRT